MATTAVINPSLWPQGKHFARRRPGGGGRRKRRGVGGEGSYGERGKGGRGRQGCRAAVVYRTEGFTGECMRRHRAK